MKNEESTFGVRRESQLYNLEFIVQRKASAHALAGFVLFVRFVFEKNIRVC